MRKIAVFTLISIFLTTNVFAMKSSIVSIHNLSIRQTSGGIKGEFFEPEVVDDSQMGYTRQTIEITSKDFNPDHEAYVARFLQHVSPSHPLLERPDFQEAIEAEKLKKGSISLVHHIPKEQLEQSEVYQEMMGELKALEFANEKLDFTDEEDYHFSIIGGLQNQEGIGAEDLVEWIQSQIGNYEEFVVEVRGPWANTFIKARAFFRNYPQGSSDDREPNRISEIIKASDGKDFLVYATAFFQLKDVLEPEEASKIRAIFDRYKDKKLFRYMIKKLDVMQFEDDLLRNKRILGTVVLRPSKVVNTNTPEARQGFYEQARALDRAGLPTIMFLEAEALEQLGKGKVLPVKGTDGLEKEWGILGVKLGERMPGDDLFRLAKLPEGWKIVPTGEVSIQSYLIDEQGREIAVIAYKPEFYDRYAWVSFRPGAYEIMGRQERLQTVFLKGA